MPRRKQDKDKIRANEEKKGCMWRWRASGLPAPGREAEDPFPLRSSVEAKPPVPVFSPPPPCAWPRFLVPLPGTPLGAVWSTEAAR